MIAFAVVGIWIAFAIVTGTQRLPDPELRRARAAIDREREAEPSVTIEPDPDNGWTVLPWVDHDWQDDASIAWSSIESAQDLARARAQLLAWTPSTDEMEIVGLVYSTPRFYPVRPMEFPEPPSSVMDWWNSHRFVTRLALRDAAAGDLAPAIDRVNGLLRRDRDALTSAERLLDAVIAAVTSEKALATAALLLDVLSERSELDDSLDRKLVELRSAITATDLSVEPLLACIEGERRRFRAEFAWIRNGRSSGHLVHGRAERIADRYFRELAAHARDPDHVRLPEDPEPDVFLEYDDRIGAMVITGCLGGEVRNIARYRDSARRMQSRRATALGMLDRLEARRRSAPPR